MVSGLTFHRAKVVLALLSRLRHFGFSPLLSSDVSESYVTTLSRYSFPPQYFIGCQLKVLPFNYTISDALLWNSHSSTLHPCLMLMVYRMSPCGLFSPLP